MKIISGLIATLLIFSSVSTSHALQYQEVNVSINGEIQKFNQPAVIKDQTTLVPMRPIFQTLGARLEWDQATQTVTGTKGNIMIQLTVGKNVASVNGKKVTLSTSAQLLNGSTMVPLRFVSEALGGTVNWDSATSTAIIKSDPVTITETGANQEYKGVIAAGSHFTLVLTEEGQVYHFGNKIYGVSMFSKNYINTMPQIIPGIKDVVFLDAKWASAVAIKEDGTVWFWGDNRSIFDTSEDSVEPRQVQGLVNIKKVSIGNDFLVALDRDGNVWTLGLNYIGQLGNGDKIEEFISFDTFDLKKRVVPHKVGGLPTVLDIAAGDEHVVALAKDGTVWSWGANEDGQLGDGTTNARSYPLQVITFGNVIAVDAGYDYSMALTQNGEVWSWGENASGQIGDATPIDRENWNNVISTPSKTKELKEIVAISAGLNYALALDRHGDVWQWGDNEEGIMGRGELKEHGSRSVPKRVVEINEVISISAGMDHSLAIKQDGTIWAWGDNKQKEISPTNTVFFNQPVQLSLSVD
jgi:alpha-tubulin suppressor-like RCC1 family protein